MTNIDNRLQLLINDPICPEYNFMLGLEYEKENHFASAFSYYLRGAEFSRDNILSYECMLRAAISLEALGNRIHSLKGMILRAMSLIPYRPEALFMMTRICEQNKDWHEAYSYAVFGETFMPEHINSLRTHLAYPGKWGFTYERAVSAWWIGLYDESIALFRSLENRVEIPEPYKSSIINNINNLAFTKKKEIQYNSYRSNDLRLKFTNYDKIHENYSQCFQDIFVLMATNGMFKGSFLEIGFGDPFYHSNTALLETAFGWYGFAIDISKEKYEEFKKHRKCKAILANALDVNYYDLLLESVYDYLQVDCEPAVTSFQVLQKIINTGRYFRVITFEHDHFSDSNSMVKEMSRKFLRSHGYELVVDDVAEDRYSEFEDWWIHPYYVPKDVIQNLKCITGKAKRADDYVYGLI